jgi:hypothetical protein
MKEGDEKWHAQLLFSKIVTSFGYESKSPDSVLVGHWSVQDTGRSGCDVTVVAIVRLVNQFFR